MGAFLGPHVTPAPGVSWSKARRRARKMQPEGHARWGLRGRVCLLRAVRQQPVGSLRCCQSSWGPSILLLLLPLLRSQRCPQPPALSLPSPSHGGNGATAAPAGGQSPPGALRGDKGSPAPLLLAPGGSRAAPEPLWVPPTRLGTNGTGVGTPDSTARHGVPCSPWPGPPWFWDHHSFGTTTVGTTTLKSPQCHAAALSVPPMLPKAAP